MSNQVSDKLLRVRGLTKSYPGVLALRDVSISVGRGEVVGLLGENGAGKSTLIKILGGAVPPDAGEILLDGKIRRFDCPQESMAAGIAIIYQELNLVPYLSIVDNLFLGKELRRGIFVDRSTQRARALLWLDRLGLKASPETFVHDLSISQQQLVEIAKALEQNARILIMDEPTAALTDSETSKLHQITRELRSSGLAIIYVSHRLDEIFSITDSVVILRDGQFIDEGPTRNFTRRQIIEKLVGRDLSSEFPPSESTPGECLLEVRGLQNPPEVVDFSISVRKGEIVGITGMVGAGRTEAARILFGADSGTIDSLRINGREVRHRNPREAIENGVALLPEDRKKQGLVLNHSCGENFLLPNLKTLSHASGLIDESGARSLFESWVNTLRIRCQGWSQPVRNLSGGNQQKIVLAKWLARNCQIFLFDEPTRGIDVGAKFEFYQWMRKLTAQGKGIIMISSDMEEILGMSDRIITMADGRITGQIDNGPSVNAGQILRLTIGSDSTPG